jgi:indole-3-glycerol phosphate synthase
MWEIAAMANVIGTNTTNAMMDDGTMFLEPNLLRNTAYAITIGICAIIAPEYIHASRSIESSSTRVLPHQPPKPPSNSIAAQSKIAITGVIAGSRYPFLGSDPCPARRNIIPIENDITMNRTERKSSEAPFGITVSSLPLATAQTMAITLQTIIEYKQEEVVKQRQDRPVDIVREEAESNERPRNFFGAVVNGHTDSSTSVIAEVKRMSPSAGIIKKDFNPVAIAKAYEMGGAAAISCLTDTHFFGGNIKSLSEIKAEVSLPVLRKDFIIDPYQIWESRAAGADAVLLIAEAISEGLLLDMMILAQDLGMTTLIEVHDMGHLLSIQQHVGFPHAGYCLLGINNRNLETMQTDLNHTIRMIDVVEDTSVVVSESGISKPEDLDRLRSHGVHIVLVGESFMKEDDPGAALQQLIRMNPT